MNDTIQWVGCMTALQRLSHDPLPHPFFEQSSLLRLRSCATLAQATVDKSVRIIYAVGSDRAFQSASLLGMRRAATDLQAWLATQLGGKTILLNSPIVETCVLPRPAAYYAGDSYNKVLADVTVCVPAKWNDPNFRWVIYAEVDEICNVGNLGKGGSGTTIMGHGDIAGLGGQRTYTGICGDTYIFGFDRWTGGLGHELGHALGLAHPPGCDQSPTASSCDSNALMWAGFYNFPNTYLRPDDKAILANSPFILATTVAARKSMTEYYYPRLDYYFITSRDSEKALLDNQSDWQRTGKSFDLFANDALALSGISRFYFGQVAKNGSRGSHFYTLIDGEKAALRSLNPGNSALPAKPLDEGVDGYAFLPLTAAGIGGLCAVGQKPVYRVFRGNARFPDDPNHRFTNDLSLYNSFVAQGWDADGVAFCTPE